MVRPLLPALVLTLPLLVLGSCGKPTSETADPPPRNPTRTLEEARPVEDPPLAVLTGRLVDGEDRPLADRTFAAECIHGWWLKGHRDSPNPLRIGDPLPVGEVHTDGDGGFELSIRTSDVPAEWAVEIGALLLYQLPAAGKPSRFALSNFWREGLPADRRDLGDLACAPIPVIATGIVRDRHGRPVPGADVYLPPERLQSTPSPLYQGPRPDLPRGSTLPFQHTVTNQAGHFVLRGWTEKKKSMLYARDSTGSLYGGKSIRIGDIGHRLTIQPRGGVRGKFHLPGDFLPHMFFVRAVNPATDEQLPLQNFRWNPAGEFQIKALPLQPCRVEILWNRHQWKEIESQQPVWSIEDVVPTSGSPAHDRRLEFDLREGFTRIVVNVSDEAGEAIRPLQCRVHGLEPDRHWVAPGSFFWTGWGRQEVAAFADSIDLTIGAEGYRSVNLESVSTDQTVVLEPE